MRNGHAVVRLGDLLLHSGAVTQEQIDEAVSRQRAGDSRPLGVLLIALGYTSAKEVELAVMRQRIRRGDIGHLDGVRLLEEAEQSAKRAGSCMEELALAAEELAKGQ